MKIDLWKENLSRKSLFYSNFDDLKKKDNLKTMIEDINRNPNQIIKNFSPMIGNEFLICLIINI